MSDHGILNPLNQVYVFNIYYWLSTLHDEEASLNPLNQVYVFNIRLRVEKKITLLFLT